MSAQFVIASSQRLVNTAPPVTAVPFSFGAWFRVASTAVANSVFVISDVATSTHYFRCQVVATVNLLCNDGVGVTQAQTAASSVVANAWHYTVCRAISATNRRVSLLRSTGAVVHAQNTTSRTPAGIDNMALGAWESDAPTSFMGGNIAEFWLTNTDIQPDGGQLLDATMRQLAYGGPFSIPHIAKDIVEYRSMRTHPLAGRVGETYHGKFGAQKWANTNGVTMGRHPPLPYWYVNPGERKLVLPF